MKKLMPEVPADTRIKCGTWAPGDYNCYCDSCGSYFQGDKRATNCAPCAYSKADSDGILFKDDRMRAYYRIYKDLEVQRLDFRLIELTCDFNEIANQLHKVYGNLYKVIEMNKREIELLKEDAGLINQVLNLKSALERIRDMKDEGIETSSMGGKFAMAIAERMIGKREKNANN